mgnify:CR=1 FL=1
MRLLPTAKLLLIFIAALVLWRRGLATLPSSMAEALVVAQLLALLKTAT